MHGLLNRHRPAFHPRGQTCSIAKRSTRKFQCLIEPWSFGRREGHAQSLAKSGSGTADTTALHRIEEAYARRDFEKRGFVVVASSQVLRRPDDPRDQISYQGPMVGKTDRFVLVLRKQGGPTTAPH